MLDVRDYINENRCLLSVTADYRPFDGVSAHPYLVNGQFFDVSLNGKSNDLHHLTFEAFVALLVDPSQHPSAGVRCKTNRPGSTPNGGRKLAKLNWEPLRARLIQEGVIGGAAQIAKPATVVAPEPGARHEQPDPDAYVVDPARRDERQRLLREHAVRPSQPRFRQALIALSGGAVCAISGCRVETAIQAAHLMPYLGEADHHPANGLLLRADLHLLFDRGRLGIEPVTRRVHLSPSTAADPTYAPFQGVALTAAHPLSMPALQERWIWYRENMFG